MKTPFGSKIKFDYSKRLKNNLKERQKLTSKLPSEKFNQTFWMKWELVEFCKINNLKKSGSKSELKGRIFAFLKQ